MRLIDALRRLRPRKKTPPVEQLLATLADKDLNVQMTFVDITYSLADDTASVGK